MKSNFRLLLLLCILIANSIILTAQSPTLNIGDPAPALKLSKWFKGKPIDHFEKGKIYVVEFWATWCAPCKAAMPRLSKLARKYKNKAVFIGVDVYEEYLPVVYRKNISQIQAFVDGMGRRMKYNVAVGDSNFMETAWIEASGEKGIPQTFVINAEGKLAWIGNPIYLAVNLEKIVKGDWHLQEALANRNSEKYIEKMDDSLRYELMQFNGNPMIPGDFGKPDSVLLVINEWVTKEPKLKYAHSVVLNTFSALLKTDQRKAYEYGKEVLLVPDYLDPPYSQIIYQIEWWSIQIKISPEIYELCAEACQAEIDQFAYPENEDFTNLYNKMSGWYWRANNKPKAIHAARKAIKAMKKKRD